MHLPVRRARRSKLLCGQGTVLVLVHNLPMSHRSCPQFYKHPLLHDRPAECKDCASTAFQTIDGRHVKHRITTTATCLTVLMVPFSEGDPELDTNILSKHFTQKREEIPHLNTILTAAIQTAAVVIISLSSSEVGYHVEHPSSLWEKDPTCNKTSTSRTSMYTPVDVSFRDRDRDLG